MISALLVAILLSLIIHPEGNELFHFRDERGITNVLSAILLAMASGFAGATSYLWRSHDRVLRIFWFLCASGLLFFALDELMQFHESVGATLDESLGKPRYFRKWNDIIVIGYGVVALPVLLFFLPRLLRLPVFPELLATAGGFYVLHTALDSIPLGLNRLEESSKLFSSGFLALSMFTALLLHVCPQDVGDRT